MPAKTALFVVRMVKNDVHGLACGAPPLTVCHRFPGLLPTCVDDLAAAVLADLASRFLGLFDSGSS